MNKRRGAVIDSRKERVLTKNYAAQAAWLYYDHNIFIDYGMLGKESSHFFANPHFVKSKQRTKISKLLFTLAWKKNEGKGAQFMYTLVQIISASLLPANFKDDRWKFENDYFKRSCIKFTMVKSLRVFLEKTFVSYVAYG